MKKNLWKHWGLFLLCLLLCACQPTYPVVAPGETAISEVITGDGIRPASQRVEAGKMVTLNMKNESQEACTWTLLTNPYTEPFNQDDLAAVWFETEIAPNTTVAVSFQSPAAPGEYDVVCRVETSTDMKFRSKWVLVQSSHEDEIQK
jgi:plastocyanin